MAMTFLQGWKGLPNARFFQAIEAEEDIQPAWKSAALDIAIGKTMADMLEEYGNLSYAYLSWLRMHGRRIVRRILRRDPKAFGLIYVEDVDKPMSVLELASHMEVGEGVILRLIHKSGLPKPPKPLGRTLKGRRYRFSVELANQYIEYWRVKDGRSSNRGEEKPGN